MAKPADRSVSLAELRFKPANSNDAARAVLSHHFVDVPHCSFARDDGISQYLGSETGMGTFPTATAHVPLDTDVPAILGEAPETSSGLRRKLLRGGFALSVFLHAAAALAIGYATITLPEEAALEEGVLSVSIVVEGNADADEVVAGDAEDTDTPEDAPRPETDLKPVEKQPVQPVEDSAETVPEPVQPVKQPEIVQPVEQKVEDILSQVPMPQLGAIAPEILIARDVAEAKTEIAAKSQTAEEKQTEPAATAAKPLPHPVSKPRDIKKIVETQQEENPAPVEKKPQAKKEKPKKEPVKKAEKRDTPQEKRKSNRGNQGDANNNAKRGDVDVSRKGDTVSENSRGDAANGETGNAARTNYKGLVNKKLARTKGRIQSPAKGKATVTFTIMANGTVSGLKVSTSSGKAAVDAAALKVVRAALPFPAIPTETGKKSWRMSVSMTFNGR